jgi:hypothetical protein
MLRDPSLRSSRWAPTLTLVCLLGVGGCADDPTLVDVAELELVAPSLVINVGATDTRNPIVLLTINTDPSNRPLTMCVSNTTTCDFEPFANTKRWMLDPGDGPKTVTVTVEDRYHVQTVLTATVNLDTTVPVAGALTATGGDGVVSLSWAAASDGLSGVRGYRLMMASAIVPPSCNYGTRLYEGTDTSFEHTTVRNGATYGYRICPLDVAGNMGVGETALARPAPEYDPPSGTVTINGGALLTRTHSVTLDLTAADASTVQSVCVSQTATCTNWVPYNATRPWELRGPDGLIAVNVWFRDIYWNVSTAPEQAIITLDTLIPSLPVITTTTVSHDGVLVEWTASTDASPIASYTLVYVPGQSAPASCTSGTQAYTGLDLSYLDAAGPPGFRTYRLCVTDEAGNVNTRAVKTAIQLVP